MVKHHDYGIDPTTTPFFLSLDASDPSNSLSGFRFFVFLSFIFFPTNANIKPGYWFFYFFLFFLFLNKQELYAITRYLTEKKEEKRDLIALCICCLSIVLEKRDKDCEVKDRDLYSFLSANYSF